MKREREKKRDWLPGVLMAAAISFLLFLYAPVDLYWQQILTSSGLISTYCLEWRQ